MKVVELFVPYDVCEIPHIKSFISECKNPKSKRSGYIFATPFNSAEADIQIPKFSDPIEKTAKSYELMMKITYAEKSPSFNLAMWRSGMSDLQTKIKFSELANRGNLDKRLSIIKDTSKVAEDRLHKLWAKSRFTYNNLLIYGDNVVAMLRKYNKNRKSLDLNEEFLRLTGNIVYDLENLIFAFKDARSSLSDLQEQIKGLNIDILSEGTIQNAQKSKLTEDIWGQIWELLGWNEKDKQFIAQNLRLLSDFDKERNSYYNSVVIIYEDLINLQGYLEEMRDDAKRSQIVPSLIDNEVERIANTINGLRQKEIDKSN